MEETFLWPRFPREKRKKRDLKVHCYRNSPSPDKPISSCFHDLWVNNLLEESGVWNQTLPTDDKRQTA